LKIFSGEFVRPTFALPFQELLLGHVPADIRVHQHQLGVADLPQDVPFRPAEPFHRLRDDSENAMGAFLPAR